MLNAFGSGKKFFAVVSDETCFPVGQMKSQAPQVQQMGLCLPKGGSSFLRGPRPENPTAVRPILSRHMRTQRPQ
jgi:hypothetical protein